MLFWLNKTSSETNLEPLNEIEKKLKLCASLHADGNYRTAYNLAKQLAETENAQSQYNLAGYFESGLYVQKNRNMALEFYKKSAVNGFAPAIEMVKIIELNRALYMKQ